MSLDGGNHGLRIALLAGILLIVLPTVTFGGVSILSLLIGDPTYMQNPLRQDLWRAMSILGDIKPSKRSPPAKYTGCPLYDCPDAR